MKSGRFWLPDIWNRSYQPNTDGGGATFLFSQTEIAAIESDLLKHLSLTRFPQMCLEYS